jgi:uncharacterized protein (TIGR02646 family)
MKHIIKENSLPEFEEWKQHYGLTEQELLDNPQLEEEKNKIWGKLSGETKRIVKEALLKEQGFICCYCQQRINFDENTFIEHFIARNTEPPKMFNYDNIFVCCDGGDKDREDQKKQGIKAAQKTPLYCDKKKDDDTLEINPLDINCETHFAYEFIESPDDKPEVIIKELSDDGKQAIQTLNLDNKVLRKMRGEFIAGFIDGISIEDIEELLPQIKQKNEDGKFLPFCAILEYILKAL